PIRNAAAPAVRLHPKQAPRHSRTWQGWAATDAPRDKSDCLTGSRQAGDGRPRIRPLLAAPSGVVAPQREVRSTWSRSGAVVVTAPRMAQDVPTPDEVLACNPRGFSGEKGSGEVTCETACFKPIAHLSAFPPTLAWAAGATRAAAAPIVVM